VIKFTPYLNIFEFFLSFFKKFSLKDFSHLLLSKSSNKNVVQFISRSSWFFFLIASIKKKKVNRKINIWLPSFYCNDPIFLLEKLNINIFFYDVDDNFRIITSSIDFLETDNKKPDIIVMCNFFGKIIDEKEQLFFYDLKKKYNAWLLQDATHCIDPNVVDSKYSDFTFISPYKFFSLPYGGLYLTNLKFLEDNSITFLNNEKLTLNFLNQIINSLNFKKKNNFKFFLKWMIKSLVNYFYFKLTIKMFENDYYIDDIDLLPNPKINFVIKNYIFFKFKKIDLIKLRIKKNSLKWKKTLINLGFKDQEKIKIDEFDINSNFTPYLLRVSSTHEIIIKYYNFLKEKKIPILTWPNLNEFIKKSNSRFNASRLRKSNFYISLNYQISPLHLKIKSLLNFDKLENKNHNYELTEIQDFQTWDRYFRKIDNNNLLQDWKYGEILSQLKNISVKRYLLKSKDETDKKCIFQLFSNSNKFINISYINRGPLFFSYVTEEEKLKIINFLLSLFDKPSKLKFLKINPEIQINSKNVFLINNKNILFLKEPHWTSSLINLKNDLDNIKKNFRGSIRNDINFFDKKINELTLNVYDNLENPVSDKNKKILENMYLKNQKEKKYNGISIDLIRKILNKSNYRLYEIIHKETKKIIAYGLFYLHFPSATYLLGVHNDKFKQYRVMTNILFMSIKDLKKIEFSFLDLGGIDYLNNKNVANFKKKFQGQEYTLVGKKSLV